MTNTPNSSQFELADRVAGGGLADEIRHLRALGLSWTSIAALIRDRHDLNLNDETLRRWGKVICSNEPTEAAS